MDNSIAPLGFEPPHAVVADTSDEEEDPEEDSKKNLDKVEDMEESENFEDSMDSNGLGYHRDPKDFDPWDD